MKAVVLVCASVITLLITTPAHAAIWDLSWLAEGFFNRLPDAPPVNRSQSGTSTATIAPQPSGGIVIGFDTPFGASSVNVPPDGPAIGNVPVFQDRNAPPAVFKGEIGRAHV